MCSQCESPVGNEEQERVQDCFDENYHSLCYNCAVQCHGEEAYMRQHSYDVAVPFAENH